MSKALKTSVKLDTKSAVSSLDKLEKKIRNINNVINKTNSRHEKDRQPGPHQSAHISFTVHVALLHRDDPR